MDNLTQIQSQRASVAIAWCHGLPRIELRLDDQKNIERTIRRIGFADDEEALAFLRSLAASVEDAMNQIEQQQDQSLDMSTSDGAIPVTLDSSDGVDLSPKTAFHFDFGQDQTGCFADLRISWGRGNEFHQSISFECGDDLMQFTRNLVAAAYFTFRDVQEFTA